MKLDPISHHRLKCGDFRLPNSFLDVTPKAQAMKGKKSTNGTLSKIKNFMLQRTASKKETYRMGKNFGKPYLIIRICKEFLQLNIKDKPIKMDNGFKQTFLLKMIY